MAQNKKHRNLIAGILLLLLIGCVVGVFLIPFLNKGDEKQRITEQESMQTENSYHGIENFVALNIPYEESSVMPYAENKEVKLGKDLLNDALISEIKKINPDFETEYYSVVYNP